MNAYRSIPRAKTILGSFSLVAVFLTACSGILPEKPNVPPVQAYQACQIGAPEAVIIDGRRWNCADLGVPPAEPTSAPTATSAPGPVAATSAPAATVPVSVAPTQPAAVPSGLVSLNYDETGNDPLTDKQVQLIALYLRPAFDKDQKALEDAIVAIQQEAATVGATVLTGKEIVIPEGQAFLVWHSNGGQVTETPADLDDVFTTHTSGVGKVWIVGPFGDPVPPREHRTFRCSEGEFWAVAVH